MRCAWKQLLSILPMSIRADVDMLGRESLQELRLRLNKPPELVTQSGSKWLGTVATAENIQFVVNTASRYSPWAAATAARGYITAPGGHRIGLCGEVVTDGGQARLVRDVTSLCIRVARDISGIGQGISCHGNVLILGPPGSGKTTLLRDLARRIAETETVAVVDERGELFPEGFDTGRRMDVLRSCEKAAGIGMVLRTMGPSTIVVDEITAAEDTLALQSALWCGVRLVATAHASNMEDLRSRRIYAPLYEQRCFDTVLTLRPDKSWYQERMMKCTSSGSARY